ncbi:MAG: hypothetical protein H8E12_16820 [Rhodobacteraceae bacterium]|nr:hypothetical protein [Paracoccaceae bacterium]
MNISNNDIFNAAFADEIIKMAGAQSHTTAFTFLKEAGIGLGAKNWLKYPGKSLSAKYQSGMGKLFNWLSGGKYVPAELRTTAAGKALKHEARAAGKLKEVDVANKARIQEKALKYHEGQKADKIKNFKQLKADKKKYAPTVAAREQAAIDAKVSEGLRLKDRKKIKDLSVKQKELEDLKKKNDSINMFAHLGRGVVGTKASTSAATVAGAGMVGVPGYLAGSYILGTNKRPTERFKFGGYVGEST